MRLQRTQFAFEEISRHLDDARDPLIESYFVQYLLVSFYAEVEEQVKSIVSRRLSRISDDGAANFVFVTNEKMFGRVRKTDINDVLVKFKCGIGDVLADALPGENLQPYFDAITNRHLVSHRTGSDMTLEAFAAALPCGETILERFDQLLNADRPVGV